MIKHIDLTSNGYDDIYLKKITLFNIEELSEKLNEKGIKVIEKEEQDSTYYFKAEDLNLKIQLVRETDKSISKGPLKPIGYLSGERPHYKLGFIIDLEGDEEQLIKAEEVIRNYKNSLLNLEGNELFNKLIKLLQN